MYYFLQHCNILESLIHAVFRHYWEWPENTENICLFAVLISATNKSVKADEGIHICYV